MQDLVTEDEWNGEVRPRLNWEVLYYSYVVWSLCQDLSDTKMYYYDKNNLISKQFVFAISLPAQKPLARPPAFFYPHGHRLQRLKWNITSIVIFVACVWQRGSVNMNFNRYFKIFPATRTKALPKSDLQTSFWHEKYYLPMELKCFCCRVLCRWEEEKATTSRSQRCFVTAEILCDGIM